MNYPSKICFRLLQRLIVLVFALHIFSKSTVFASPVPSLNLMDPQSRNQVVAECCKLHITNKPHALHKVVRDEDSTPGKGQLTSLLRSDVYRQRITRKKCMFNKHSQHNFCQDPTVQGSNICESDYVKQKAIVQDGWIREIWVEDGCRFGRL